MNEIERPRWALSRSIDEKMFITEFLERHKLTFCNGRFYDVNGCVRDEWPLKREIYKMLSTYYNGSGSKVDSLLEAMRYELMGNDVHTEPHLIHVANGTVNLEEDFTEYKYICPYRLPVKYEPQQFCPEHWCAFVHDLLEPEDILTLQEYLGYCLIPSNAAQKMLMIIGEGGEGKSRIGVAMKAVLGQSMHNGSIDKVEHDRFARADLENVLLLVDDDLKLEALNTTHHLKSIITADTPMDLERKGEQSYQGMLYCRFLAFGNGSLQALHDRSYGFFRRQIILTAKPRDPQRIDDPYLGDKLAAEADGIFLWCLEGLRRLRENHFRFTVSEKARKNWENAIKDSNNMVEFLESDGYFSFDPEGAASSKQLYEVYLDWCSDNAHKPFGMKSFCNYLGSNYQKYNLTPSNNIYIGNCKRLRGFVGIRILPRY